MYPLRIVAIFSAAVPLAACGKKHDPGFQGWVEGDLIFVGPDEANRLDWLKVRRTIPSRRSHYCSRSIAIVCSGVICDQVEPNASPAKSAMALEAEVNSGHWRPRHGHDGLISLSAT
jgi:hypothetical protein